MRPTLLLTKRRSSLSTSLFEELWADALDPGYALAAARRTSAARDRRPGADPRAEPAASDPDVGAGAPVDADLTAPLRHGVRGRLHGASIRAALALTLVGGLLGFGIHQTSTSARTGAQTRTSLLAQVAEVQREVQTLESTAGQLRQQVVSARSDRLALSGEGNAVAQRLKSFEGAAAAVAVSGPGVTVTLADAPPPAGAGSRLTDRDLQAVVNALWGAGAEAISVGGHRLGPQTAIRTAGQAVLVDFQPVSSPYSVQAIGAADMLTTGLADSAAGRRLRTLQAVYGIGLKVSSTGVLTLPAATPATPRSATALIPASTAPASGGAP